MATGDHQFRTQDDGTIEHHPIPPPVKRSAIVVGTLKDDATPEAEADQTRSGKQIVWMYPVKKGADYIARNVIYYKSKGNLVERQVSHASVHYDAIFSYIPYLTHEKLGEDALRNAAHVSMVLALWSRVVDEALEHEEESEVDCEPPLKKLKLGESKAASKDDDETEKEKDRKKKQGDDDQENPAPQAKNRDGPGNQSQELSRKLVSISHWQAHTRTPR